MFRKVIIISGGRLGDPDFFRQRLEAPGNILAICCDGGIRHLKKLKIRPAVIIGDMDSADDAQLTSLKASGVKVLTYPAGKDATDTQLALDYALGLNPEAIEIWGALGGRIDHTLANLFLLGFGEQKGISPRLIDEYCEAFIAGEETSFHEAIGQTVSLLALSPKAEGITLRNFQYPLDNETLEMTTPRGISNIIAASPATIHVDSGSLLVIRYWRKDVFPEVV